MEAPPLPVNIYQAWLKMLGQSVNYTLKFLESDPSQKFCVKANFKMAAILPEGCLSGATTFNRMALQQNNSGVVSHTKTWHSIVLSIILLVSFC
jgi:hypothetical protein